ncbi:sterol desaturase/sphingolipid hydroxylase (fatty acid hydroxylase superfamily) [Algoriphagus sp. 4150]|uniref:sterol desaturase family protein n=1 Tax=Algoriphagus sp. 4150 TaxID=2817756 RepID=UPI002854773F|nr:sterol desaturase family protein [Algoriphagus sp. 4150]MDR7127787.1 sterol desaturase/sphingolipid hydroxylase (fatty acid hydroxylase superfamily) [Algoriphagus sp. 4150]
MDFFRFSDVPSLLTRLAEGPMAISLFVFWLLNLLILGMALGLGRLILIQYRQPIRPSRPKDWSISMLTVCTNALITQLGLYLYSLGYLQVNFEWHPLKLIVGLFGLFFAMDLLMFIFHYLIHRTKLHRTIHALHHQAIHPKPIDLFVLHPIETVGFGILFIGVLCCISFQVYAIIIYLVLNVLFGIVGHLGFEPLKKWPENKYSVLNYLGISSFHHLHHENVNCNFGFYTNLWDSLFGTYHQTRG